MINQDAKQALESLLNIKLPDDFEAHIEVHAPSLQSGATRGTISSKSGTLAVHLNDFAKLRGGQVACW